MKLKHLAALAALAALPVAAQMAPAPDARAELQATSNAKVEPHTEKAAAKPAPKAKAAKNDSSKPRKTTKPKKPKPPKPAAKPAG